MVAINFCSGRF